MLVSQMSAPSTAMPGDLPWQHALLEATGAGLMAFACVRDAAGEIIDFRWTYANETAARIVGKPPDWFRDRLLLVEMPGNKAEGLFDAYVDVVRTGQPMSREFSYVHEGIDAWFRNVAVRTVDGFAVSFIDITPQKQAEEQRDLVAQELVHRVKNIFAVVLSLAALGQGKDATVRAYSGLLRQRIGALARAHDFFRRGGVSTVSSPGSLQGLLAAVLEPYGAQDNPRFRITGPDILVGEQAARALSLIIHELATNALKHGALADVGDGTVTIACKDLSPEEVGLVWTERGGPPVNGAPEMTGFGATLVERTARLGLGARIARYWEEQGLSVELAIPRASLSS
jgi:two-component sensor histidine kinase